MKIKLLVLTAVLLMGCGHCLNRKNLPKTKNSVYKFDKNYFYKNLRYFGNDTLSYLRENFVNNKDYYLQKKLKVLLKDLELPVQNHLVSLSGNNTSFSDGITLILTDEKTFYSNKKKGKYILLNISWDSFVDSKSALELLDSNKMRWNDKVKDFYINRIVKDVNMVKVNNLKSHKNG